MSSTLFRWKELEEGGGVWRYSGNPKSPHVSLRSGLHSDGFIDTLQYLSVVPSLVEASSHLASKIRQVIGNLKIDWVIGSPMAGVQFAAMVGMHIGSRRVGFTEKGKTPTDLICRFDMEPGSMVLLIEEMSTTGATPQRGIDAVLAQNPGVEIIPYVGAFLTRCGRITPELRSAEFIPLIDLSNFDVGFHTWEPSECPLCASGSRVMGNIKKVWAHALHNMIDPSYEIPGAEYL